MKTRLKAERNERGAKQEKYVSFVNQCGDDSGNDRSPSPARSREG